MRVVIQRVKKASVTIDNRIKSSINRGLLILIGICDEDTKEDIEWLTKKIINLRVFDDENGVMNCSAIETNAEIMVVSQFTLYASCKKGNRPSYIKAAKPEISIPLYQEFCKTIQQNINTTVKTGEFGADMKVELINDGPVTICIDTKNKE